jgi:hypothetical protein
MVGKRANEVSGVRDWADWDPSYSENDADHPRNRPVGWRPAQPVAPEVGDRLRATMLATLRASRAAVRATAAVPVPSGRVRSAAGTAAVDLPPGHREKAYQAYEELRAKYYGNRASAAPGMVAAARLEAEHRPGHACMWW